MSDLLFVNAIAPAHVRSLQTVRGRGAGAAKEQQRTLGSLSSSFYPRSPREKSHKRSQPLPFFERLSRQIPQFGNVHSSTRGALRGSVRRAGGIACGRG